jgi:arginase
LAVKIVRQPKKIALIGAPSSAAAFLPGTEKAPAALRAAGLVEQLHSIGCEVTDHGDSAPRLFADDEEHKRARNLKEIVAGLNDLKLRAEAAVKTGALVLVLGGDCAQSMGLLAGARRYYKHVNLLWFDRDADLNTPASTPSGRIDGMVVAHVIGRGAPELVRFWGESPLVREPDVTLFGLERVDPPEQEFLTRSPMRHIYAADIRFKGGSASGRNALAAVHADAHEFVLHLDVDVIANGEFSAVNLPDTIGDGVSFADVRAALREIARHKNLLGISVSQYNPDKDPDGSAAKKLVELLVGAVSARLDSEAEASQPETKQEAAPVPKPAAESEPVSVPVAEPPTTPAEDPAHGEDTGDSTHSPAANSEPPELGQARREPSHAGSEPTSASSGDEDSGSHQAG